MDDLISRKMAIDAIIDHIREKFAQRDTPLNYISGLYKAEDIIEILPSAQPVEVTPHRNYKYLSDYWCECGWHLGKKGDVKYCPDCGRKVKWNE